MEKVIAMKPNTLMIPVMETITPDRAKMWLENNTHNRNVRPKVLERYCEAIKSGQWELNGETIKFAEDGTLLDGQHRLQAVIMANKSIQSFIVRGLPNEVFDTIDTGTGRAARDFLTVIGEANTSVLATAARIWYLHNELKEGYLGTMSKWAGLTTDRDIIETVKRYPGLKESVSSVMGKNTLKPYLSPGIAAYLHFYFSTIDASQAEVFFSKLREGDGLSVNHPILHLRNKLVNVKGETKDGRVKKVALTIKAWNFFRKNRYVKDLEWRPKEYEFPVAE